MLLLPARGIQPAPSAAESRISELAEAPIELASPRNLISMEDGFS